jgi:16S rRNA processing protein RimM
VIKEHSQDFPPPEGQYYHHQIIGLQVRTTRGELLGNVTDVLSGKSNDNYIIQGPRGEILIPAIEDVIKSIDLDQGYMTIEAIEGLLSLNEKSCRNNQQL